MCEYTNTRQIPILPRHLTHLYLACYWRAEKTLKLLLLLDNFLMHLLLRICECVCRNPNTVFYTFNVRSSIVNHVSKLVVVK